MAGASVDDSLLRALHDAHGPALWHFALQLTRGDHARAQDVVQETMLRAWRTPRVLAQTEGSVRGWLFTVARRIVIDEWRAARTRPEQLADVVPERPLPDVTGAMLDRSLMLAALRMLSAEHREVLFECYYRGATVAQAAATLGIPPGTVKSRAHYGLRALKLALAELGSS
jgi:RNA polymerase sigma-70 factor (ECF subfamily)